MLGECVCARAFVCLNINCPLDIGVATCHVTVRTNGIRPYALLRISSLLEAAWAVIRRSLTHSILHQCTARPLRREVDEHISHRHLQDVCASLVGTLLQSGQCLHGGQCLGGLVTNILVRT